MRSAVSSLSSVPVLAPRAGTAAWLPGRLISWTPDKSTELHDHAGSLGALTVHAYSPPLTAMSYDEVTGDEALRRTRTVLTDQPEGEN